MVQKIAMEVMTPKATRGPPRRLVSWKATRYSGMKTLSNPKAISWKKNPRRHIANALFRRCIKTLLERKAGFL
jgi:hypothetical protein